MVWLVERGQRVEPGTVREGIGYVMLQFRHNCNRVVYAHISVSLAGRDSGGGRLLSPLTHL